MASSVGITVNGVAEERCRVDATTDWTVQQVLEAIHKQIGIPVRCQILCHNDEQLHFQAAVGSLISKDAKSLILTLVVEEEPGPEALWEAIKSKDVARALSLLKRQEPPGLNDLQPQSVLAEALDQQLPEVALAILSRPDFMQVYAFWLVTPLDHAVQYNFLDVCHALFARSDFEMLHLGSKTQVSMFKTPGQAAEERGHKEVAALLRDREVASIPLQSAIHRGNAEEALRVLQQEQIPDLNAIVHFGCTTLHQALNNELPDVALAILARPDFVNVNWINDNDDTILHWAASHGYLQVCKAIVNRPDFSKLLYIGGGNWSPDEAVSNLKASQLARVCGHEEVARFLEEAEAAFLAAAGVAEQ